MLYCYKTSPNGYVDAQSISALPCCQFCPYCGANSSTCFFVPEQQVRPVSKIARQTLQFRILGQLDQPIKSKDFETVQFRQFLKAVFFNSASER